MKKGQMEILGFMVIILLIVVGIILYIKFMPEDTSTAVIQETETNLEVSNMLSAFRLQTICEDTQGNDIIKAYIKGGFECSQEPEELIVEQLALTTSAYGWDEDSYMFYIDEELLTEECPTEKFTRLPDEATISGTKVRLVYCYE